MIQQILTKQGIRYESTTKTPTKKMRTYRKLVIPEVRQNTKDARIPTMCSRGGDDSLTDEATRSRERYISYSSTATRTERKKQRRKQGNMQQNRTEGVDSIIPYRLCYKAEPWTLPHVLPSPSNSRPQRYHLVVLPLSHPAPPSEQLNKKRNYYLVGLGGCSITGSTS